MQDVVSILKSTIFPNQCHIIIKDNNDNIIKEQRNNSLRESLDINDDLDINDISDLLDVIDVINYGSHSQNQTSILARIMDLENNQSSISIQTNLSKDTFDSTFSTLIVDKLITF